MPTDVYVITTDDRMRNLATGELIGDQPAGNGLGLSALGTDPLGD